MCYCYSVVVEAGAGTASSPCVVIVSLLVVSSCGHQVVWRCDHVGLGKVVRRLYGARLTWGPRAGEAWVSYGPTSLRLRDEEERREGERKRRGEERNRGAADSEQQTD